MVTEHTAEPRPTLNARVVRRNDTESANQPVPQSSMIALFVEMRHVFRDRTTQGPLPYKNHLRQAFFPDRAYEALRERVQVR